MYFVSPDTGRQGRSKTLISKNEVNKILLDNVIGKYRKKQITSLIEAYGNVLIKHVSENFGWEIPGVVKIKFVDKNDTDTTTEEDGAIISNEDNIKFYPYNSASLIQEAAKEVDLDYLAAEYIINEYFDICFYLLSKNFGPTLCDVFTTSFSESYLHTVRFVPSAKLKATCDDKGLTFSSKVVIKKYQKREDAF